MTLADYATVPWSLHFPAWFQCGVGDSMHLPQLDLNLGRVAACDDRVTAAHTVV